MDSDIEFMRLAIELSSKAEYPYGAIIVKNGQIIGRSDAETKIKSTVVWKNKDKEVGIKFEKLSATQISDIKTFLKLAARRHYVFNYKKIAEYYAMASEEMQELMEKSALVIIDYNNAIANGYVKLSKKLEELRIGNA